MLKLESISGFVPYPRLNNLCPYVKMNLGEIVISKENIEIFFDLIDTSALIFFEELKMPYLEGITEAANNLLSGSVDQKLSKVSKNKIESMINRVNTIDFQKEEVRKAMQLCILKGFKHQKRTNADITPDTIGLFIAFLLEKLYANSNNIVLFDPLVGTGNLITTIANHSDKISKLIGVESNIESYRLAEAMFDMMDYGNELYFQDTLLFHHLRADAIVADFPYSQLDKGSYFPYDFINHHSNNLAIGGYFLGVVPNDFFEIPGSDMFKDVIKNLWQVVGLVKLPSTLFKGIGKSIFILRRSDDSIPKIEKVLLADITSFEDEEVLQIQIAKINLWFKTNLDNRGETI
jgi:site-specific DNA-methyltransferase (adenine-specific)